MLAVSATVAHAAYIVNFSGWKALSKRDQASYAAGLLDSRLMPSGGDSGALAISQGLDNCSVGISMTSDMVADAITKYYEDNPSRWGFAPVVAFHERIIRGACLSFINMERAKYGLEPWSK